MSWSSSRGRCFWARENVVAEDPTRRCLYNISHLYYTQGNIMEPGPRAGSGTYLLISVATSLSSIVFRLA